MKAITLTNPWANLVATGQKRIETRSWKTAYRGTLAIHSGKTLPVWARQAIKERPDLHAAMYDAQGAPPPMGCIVAVVSLMAVVKTEETADWHNVSPRERTFGDFTPGRYAWLLGELQRLDKPIPCKGSRLLWTLPDDIYEQVKLQLCPECLKTDPGVPCVGCGRNKSPAFPVFPKGVPAPVEESEATINKFYEK